MPAAEKHNFQYIHTINPYKKIESFNTLVNFHAGTPIGDVISDSLFVTTR